MRAFLAVALPEEARRSLTKLQETLAQSRAEVKWVEPPNLHVTLKFFGEVTDEQRQAIEGLLRRLAHQEGPFGLALDGLGAFPSLTAPRVIWVGLAEGTQALARIAGAIEREGAAMRLANEERPFAAHVTLGRVRSPRTRQALVQRLHASAWRPPTPWPVASLRLYQSILTPGGPRYSVLAEFPLGRENSP